jgi:hypothetical protein
MPKPTETKEIRLLVDSQINGSAVKSGRVVKVLSATAAELVASSQADDNADSVAYALTENPEVIDLSQLANPEAEQHNPELPVT